MNYGMRGANPATSINARYLQASIVHPESHAVQWVTSMAGMW
jgi:hypothetical protein